MSIYIVKGEYRAVTSTIVTQLDACCAANAFFTRTYRK